MRKIIFSILLILLTGLILSPNVFSQSDTSSQINIPLILTDEGHTIVKAKINGVEGNFIFDTGAGLNLLTKKFADTINDLERTDGFYAGYRSTGEKLELNLWIAKIFELNAFSVKDENFSVYDVDFPLDGLISLTAFKDVPITIDYKNEVLVIESDESMEERIEEGETIPIQISEEREKTLSISTYIYLNNKLKLQVYLDSGAGLGVFKFSSRYMKSLEIDSSQIDHEYKRSEFNPEVGNEIYFTRIPEMRTLNGKKEVKNFEATFVDGLIYEGIMSINWLGDKITIDIPKKRMIVK